MKHESPTILVNGSRQGAAFSVAQGAPVRATQPACPSLPLLLQEGLTTDVLTNARRLGRITRLSRPSLVPQHPLVDPNPSLQGPQQRTLPASLAYKTSENAAPTNPDPFLLTPILNLPPSFGSAYVGETFSCTLCANHEPPAPDDDTEGGTTSPPKKAPRKKFIRDVRIEAEMKTPGAAAALKLRLVGGDDAPKPPSPSATPGEGGDDEKAAAAAAEEAERRRKEEEENRLEKDVAEGGTDLDPGATLQRIVNFDLKEEGNHVLAVTVSYYEATETSGRARTFRKLYQFICKSSLIVRTKVGAVPAHPPPAGKQGGEEGGEQEKEKEGPRRWVLEAQLENCSEDIMQLERVGLDLLPGLAYRDANWMVSGSAKPVLHPGEVEQVCFIVEEAAAGAAEQPPPDGDDDDGPRDEDRVVFGILGIGWRTEMGNRGFLTTGKLAARVAAR